MDNNTLANLDNRDRDTNETDIKKRVVDLIINNQNDAFQCIIQFINVAHKRGCYTIEETHKIWECIKHFQ